MSEHSPSNPATMWTVMVYLAGDNNLERFGVKDLVEMKAGGSTDDVALVAQFDRMSDQVTRRYYLTRDQDLSADCVAELPEVNTGDPDALVDFISWTCQTYPAERYALILWNHGSGWKDDDIYRAVERKEVAGQIGRGQLRALRSGKPGRALFATTLEELVVQASERAILFDDSAADFLDSQELREVLERALPAFDGRPILLGFDACLMSMMEVYYQIGDLCQVAVGSQEIEPGDGWPYDAVLARLAAEPGMTPESLGKVIVDAYVGFYRTGYPHLAVTQSAVSLAGVETLAQAVSALGSALLQSLSSPLTLGLVFSALRSAQSFTDRDYLDLAHFCRLLAELDASGSAGAAARHVVDLMDGDGSAVIASACHGASVQNATGISIYLPTRILSPLYAGLLFSQQSAWDEFVSALVGPG